MLRREQTRTGRNECKRENAHTRSMRGEHAVRGWLTFDESKHEREGTSALGEGRGKRAQAGKVASAVGVQDTRWKRKSEKKERARDRVTGEATVTSSPSLDTAQPSERGEGERVRRGQCEERR